MQSNYWTEKIKEVKANQDIDNNKNIIEKK